MISASGEKFDKNFASLSPGITIFVISCVLILLTSVLSIARTEAKPFQILERCQELSRKNNQVNLDSRLERLMLRLKCLNVGEQKVSPHVPLSVLEIAQSERERNGRIGTSVGGLANHHHQFTLGWKYYTGVGFSQNYETAKRFFTLAANGGYAPAQRMLGVLYSHGRGVSKDYQKAFAWFRLAASQGNIKAQHSLGDMYHYGKGVTRNFGRAIYWYTIESSSETQGKEALSMGKVSVGQTPKKHQESFP